MKKRRKAFEKFDLKSVLDSMTCAKCGATLLGPRSIRLKSRPKMGHKMQKLLRKKNRPEFSLTKQQERLLQRSMKCHNVLVLKCTQCQWTGKQLLQSRADCHLYKLQRKKGTLSMQSENPSALDKKAKLRMKKKEKKKKAAAARALELQSMQSNFRIKTASVILAASSTCKAGQGTTPVPATPPFVSHLQTEPRLLSVSNSDAGNKARGSDGYRTNSPNAAKARGSWRDVGSKPGASKKPTLTSACSASSANSINGGSGAGRVLKPVRTVTTRPKQSHTAPGLQGGKITKKGRRTLKNMLGQKQPGTPSVKDSLIAFLDSLK